MGKKLVTSNYLPSLDHICFLVYQHIVGYEEML